jgi:hypothetical protein
VEARFDAEKPIPHGDNGNYQIKGGMFSGNGIFLNVSRKAREDLDFQSKDNANYDNFFICHSHSVPQGRHYLRWRIALKKFENETRP